jgi:hypothetical protein
MAVFTDLDRRVCEPPFDKAGYDARRPVCDDVASKMPIVHVTGYKRLFKYIFINDPHEIPPTDGSHSLSSGTRKAEDLLGFKRSVYFYAGRAHRKFGNVALAFFACCEENHTGSATPFDSGGLVHPRRFIKLKLDSDDESRLVQYGKESVLSLSEWRTVFGKILAAYFDNVIDYWKGKPNPHDPEGLYELNDEWRAWTFEVRFYEGQSIFDRAAWCTDEPLWNRLRRDHDGQETKPPGDPPTALDRFMEGPGLIIAPGSATFCDEVERWVRKEVGL